MLIAPEKGLRRFNPGILPASARRLVLAAAFLPLVANLAGCQPPKEGSTNGSGPTNIAIGPKVIRTAVKRLGINLSGQTFYDSGQMMRDLTYRNPGFEGAIWQSVVQCRMVNGDSCADTDEWSSWPVDLAKGAGYEFLTGPAAGQSGIVTGNSLASKPLHQGVWIHFGGLKNHPQVGDLYILRFRIPGKAQSGWWTDYKDGATISTEFKDLSPSSPGKQAVKLTALEGSQVASITSNVDSFNGRSFVQLKGGYTLNFRAKGLGGNNQLSVVINRITDKHGNAGQLNQTISLTNAWHDYKIPFTAHEDGTYVGTLQVIFGVHGAAVLLDDASLMEDASPDNPTAFRNAVVARLRELKPGVLRYMDNGNNFGSSIDNLLAVPYARERAGYNLTSADHEDVPIGLHDFLVLCQTLHTEPWFTMPAAMTQAEMTHLMEYLSAPATTPYGSRRAKMGQAAPWTTVFPMIHLELGNETWNSIFFGEAFPDPISYATRTGVIFGTARSSPFYDKNKIDLIMDGFVAYAGWNEQELSVKTNADTIDIAPYTFNEFNDASSTEAIFGPMFAEPEAMDSRPKGLVAVQAALAAKAGVKLAVYEVNLSTVKGTANAEQVEATVPSLGAGLSVADHMLLMLRDNGIMNQALFALPEYSNGFTDTSHPEANRSMKLWGSVVDMGGETNRVRPTFAAEALANSGIEDKMLETVQSGGNPTWNQPESANGKIKLSGAHMIQSFAFTDGKESSVILFNLSRTDGLPVTFSGSNPPQGAVQAELLTSANLTDTNESSEKVKTTTQAIKQFNPAHPYMLPPHSMTVLSWKSN